MAAMATPARPCRRCRALTTKGAFCLSCAPIAERERHNKAYDTREWRIARAKAMANHLRLHGHVCLGDENHPGHPSYDLTVDHTTPLSEGGHLTDQPLRVMCRSSNSRRGGNRAR